jgi:hypothetical protein
MYTLEPNSLTSLREVLGSEGADFAAKTCSENAEAIKASFQKLLKAFELGNIYEQLRTLDHIIWQYRPNGLDGYKHRQLLTEALELLIKEYHLSEEAKTIASNE